jgi:hypothetical protein
MQHLLVDRDEHGEAFTWIHLQRVWRLSFALTWQPHGGGGSGVTLADVAAMPIRQAMAWYRWIGEARESEAKAIQAAREKARAR